MSDRRAGFVRFARAVCADPWLAEDLVQDVLTVISGRWAQVSQVDDPDAYVRRAIVNRYLSMRRQRWWTSAQLRPEPPEHAGPPYDHAEAHATRSELANELAALPPQQRTALVLRYYCDLTMAEIAQIIGCREATARGYISRGLKTLRIDLDHAKKVDES